MQLVSLRVFHDNEIIREVKFKSGLNIITNAGVNGNQIGKSTVLRAIAFCLGSDAHSLWKDPDNKSENVDVKKFILDEDVVFELKIKHVVTHTLKRFVYEKQQKNRVLVKTEGWVNDTHVTSVNGYKQEVSKSIFNYHQDQPSFNTIRSKFTRINRLTSNNSLNYLDVHTSITDYTMIYSTLFGFAGLSHLKEEMNIKHEMDKNNRRSDAILNGRDLIEISDAIKDIDTQIEHYENEESEIDLTALQGEVLEQLRELRKNISIISNEVASLETRLIYNNRTIEKYRENQVDIDIDMVNDIYSEAVGYVPSVSKSLEETIGFHNAIFLEKALQSERRNEILSAELKLKREVLIEGIEKEKHEIKKLSGEGHLTGLILVEKEIQSLREKRGRLAYVFDETRNINRENRRLNILLQKTKDRVELLVSGLKENIDEFNGYFSKLTRKLFKTHSNSLNVDIDAKNDLRFSVVNSDKNTGDGTPRAEAMAFDIALVEYLKTLNVKLPEFTLQDYLESVDEDKLGTLFSYSSKNDIQVIVSILNDKLNLLPENFVVENTILELSSKNKFFKL